MQCIFKYVLLFSKKYILIVLSFLLITNTRAQVYYVSSSQGNDMNDGLSVQSPFQSINKINSIHFNPGDSIYFKSGDYWEGMFWINGSGTLSEPIVIDVYGGNNRPVINDLDITSILIFNDHIFILMV